MRRPLHLTNANSPLCVLLLGISGILHLAKAAFHTEGIEATLDLSRDDALLHVARRGAMWCGHSYLCSLSCKINSLIRLGDATNKFLLASCNAGHALDKHIWLKTKVAT